MSRSILPTLLLTIPLLSLAGPSAATEVPIEKAVQTGIAGVMPSERSTRSDTSTNAESKASSASDARRKGAQWLLQAQQKDGGWGSGVHGNRSADVTSDVATTAVSVLALVRDAAGSERYRDAVTRGVQYVVGAVDEAPRNSPRLNTPQGTQIQRKLGELSDTHLASMMLAEVSGTLDKETNRRVLVALDTVVGKVQMAQKGDGSFDGNAWAPVLSNSVAAMGLMRAKEKGVDVDLKVLERAESYQSRNVGTGGGAFASADGAGVELYSVAGALRVASKAAKTTGSADMVVAQEAAESRIDRETDKIISGFGSIGGEEMLSYMMISDSLAEQGGDKWTKWEDRIGDYLVRIQNADGSWVGHHCITSRTFVTASAVLTLGAGDAVTQAG